MPADSLAASPHDVLNAEQKAAACYGEPAPGGVSAGPLLVIAGAGTGKTMTLAHRVAHLVTAGVAPERILLMTFSRRAAREMTDRARRIVSRTSSGTGAVRLPWSGTFHSVASRILREFAPNLALEPDFSVLDRGDAADLMDVCRQEQQMTSLDRRFPRKDTCLSIYSRCVNAQAALEDCLADFFPWCTDWESELRQLFRAYAAAKRTAALLDYDDLLLYWHEMMQTDVLAAAVGERFDHVLVDEYQDTNRLQAGIVRALRPDGRGVTVVGDDAQSIYAFRAAEVENILGFPAQYAPPATVITLERNYRSTQGVLDAANELIGEGRRQYQKRLRANRGPGQRPVYVTVEDDVDQVDYVVSSVLAARETGVRLMDQAVLFRNAHHSDRLELELTRRNIPFVKYGGLKFLESGHVKDYLSALRWADNPRNRIAAFRCLQLLPGIGPGTASRAFDFLAAAGGAFPALAGFSPPPAARADWPALVALLAGVAADEGDWRPQAGQVRAWYQLHLERLYDNWAVRAGDLDALEAIAGQYGSREQFLTELSLDPPQATGDQSGPPLLDEDYLVLSTIHSAKGQEWDSVYVLNVADGNFPSEFAAGRPEQVEEERRLLYVAMTRAKSALHLVAPLKYWVTQQPKLGARHVYGARSRFLSEKVMSRLDPAFHSAADRQPGTGGRPAVVIDVGERLKGLW
jgi:DNA helicase-2/ATP-dependent DNA helicase PcrA